MNKRYQLNEGIKSTQLRVIKGDGKNLGVIDKKEALALAKLEGKDLVVIVETTTPPVAKILDFNKFLYEEKKKSSAAKAKSKKSELKEFRFGPNIGAGDLNDRVERAKEFLAENNRVQFTVQMKGREQAYPEIAFEKLEKVEKDLKGIGRIEDRVKKMGNRVMATFIRG